MANKNQQVLWTCLPNGVSDGGELLQLSVLVSPRLRLTQAAGAFELAQFPDFVDWPATLANTSFQVSFGADTVEASRISAPDPTVWRAIFAPETFVRPYDFEDLTDAKVVSYPLAKLHDAFQDLYVNLLQTADDELPPTRDLNQLLGEIRDFTNFRGQTEHKQQRPFGFRYFDSLRDKEDFPGSNFASIRPLFEPLTKFSAYHTPLSLPAQSSYQNKGPDDPREDAKWSTFKQVAMPKPEDFKDLIDFHQIVSAMNQYPVLLRLLGLVVDLTVPRRALPAGPTEHWLSVKVDWAPASDTGAGVVADPDILPFTRTRLTPDGFEPRPRNASTPIEGRMLRLADDNFRLLQVDVDGMVMKSLGFGASLRTLPLSDNTTEEEKDQVRRDGAPSLRTSGLTLAEEGRGGALETAIQNAADFQNQANSNQDVLVYAEDLIRGFRIDIHDKTTGQWQSLCRRDGAYRLTRTSDLLQTSDEEGMVRLGATTTPEDGVNDDIVKLHEGVFTWSGWSLSAPMPGLTIDPEDQPKSLDNQAPDGIGLEANFEAHPGSLPSLRFGRDYRLRARIVDLAGNSLPFTEDEIGTPNTASNPERYLRFEPVEAPALALIKDGPPVTEPGPGESMSIVAIRSYNATEADNSIPAAEQADRLALPNNIKQSQIIQHSMLDTGGKLDPASFQLLSTRDGVLEAVDFMTPGPTPASPLVPVTYAVLPETSGLPYLADPFAEAAVARIFDLPGQDPNDLIPALFVDAASPWPDALPFKIHIFEQDGATAGYDAGTRTLNVPLPKAEVAKLRLSCLLPAGALEQMGLWEWATAGLTPDQVDTLRARIERGQHWMFTPWRTLTLVHAVQKPLVTPDVSLLTVSRQANATWARPTFRTPIHAKSTLKLDLLGQWNEPQDRPAAGSPRNLAMAGHAFERRIRRTEAESGILSVQGRHEFGDTRYRRITYHAEATTRFREYMPEAIKAVPDNAAIKVVSDEQTVWAANAAQPPAPEVLYVVPTFGWSRDKIGRGGRTSWRGGGGLRVYLDRPWYTSGWGEMLGVVLPPENASTTAIDGAYKPFVTQWGTDPIWGGATIKTAAPRPNRFPLRVADRDDLGPYRPDFMPPEELELRPGPFPTSQLPHPDAAQGNLHLDVVPHEVGYDADRDLYFCDIVIRPGTVYYPFVRLALARYHPVSVYRMNLSQIVLAEFMQLTPDRSVVVTPDRRNPLVRKIGVFGHRYSQSTGSRENSTVARQTVIEVTLEKMNETIGTDLGWQKVADIRPTRDRGTLSLVTETGRRKPTATAIKRAKVDGERLVAKGDFKAVLRDPVIFDVIRPPSIWQGSITLPDRPATKNRYRLLIAEYEEHLTDSRGRDSRRRPVFVEVVNL